MGKRAETVAVISLTTVETHREPESTPQQNPAVCDRCVMAGSVPPPFIASFVPCPVFAIGDCVGLITVLCTGLPIPLGTNL